MTAFFAQHTFAMATSTHPAVHKVVGFDIETRNLALAASPGNNRVYTIALYDLANNRAHIFDARRKPPGDVSHIEAALASMETFVADGYTITGYNSLGFDFRILHDALATHKSRARAQRMGPMVLGHVDIAYTRWVVEGYATSLEAHARATLGSKKNGSGANVESTWAAADRETDAGRADAIYDSVGTYCANDAKLTAQLYAHGLTHGHIDRYTKKQIEEHDTNGKEPTSSHRFPLPFCEKTSGPRWWTAGETLRNGGGNMQPPGGGSGPFYEFCSKTFDFTTQADWLLFPKP